MRADSCEKQPRSRVMCWPLGYAYCRVLMLTPARTPPQQVEPFFCRDAEDIQLKLCRRTICCRRLQGLDLKTLLQL